MSVRVRFAPSPTGYLHIGGARTALFNWLYARKQSGVFILRIEDTDLERSSAQMVEGILEGLSWLGLNWDEGPYRQSERLELYRSISQKLLDAGHVYRCFCSPEVLEQKKREAPQGGREWQYDGKCRNLSKAEVEANMRAGRPFALRFQVPEKQCVQFEDLVYGSVGVDTDNIEDFVILRCEGTPTYHLSVVADDTDMQVSHVVRGVDHLTNTSKHVLLYQALEKPLPTFAHLPLILGLDKKRLSKRHGATSVLEYREQGFVPAALKNYLARLGWSPAEDRGLFAESELIPHFDLGRVNKANAIFDPQKLEWTNAKCISMLTPGELEADVRSLLQKESLWNSCWGDEERGRLLDTIELLKPRVRRLPDFIDQGRPFFSDDFEYEQAAIDKHLAHEDSEQAAALIQAVQALLSAYQGLAVFDLESTEKVLRDVGKQAGVKSGRFIGAVRVALTGKAVAPGIFEVIVTLGKAKTLQRLNRLLAFLQ